jgi:hypothetical protein
VQVTQMRSVPTSAGSAAAHRDLFVQHREQSEKALRALTVPVFALDGDPPAPLSFGCFLRGSTLEAVELGFGVQPGRPAQVIVRSALAAGPDIDIEFQLKRWCLDALIPEVGRARDVCLTVDGRAIDATYIAADDIWVCATGHSANGILLDIFVCSRCWTLSETALVRLKDPEPFISGRRQFERAILDRESRKRDCS